MDINEEKFKVIVKPNSLRSEIIGYDSERNAYRVNIKAPADKNKANNELIRFLSKELGRRLHIKSGFTSKEKIMEVL